MKEIKLSKGFVALVDDEDYERVSSISWYALKSRQRIYACNRKLGLMHRIIMSTPEDMEVDHLDWNGLNNQKTNLRNCSRSTNGQNMKRTRGGYVGVYLDKRDNRIFSSIGFQGKNINLGRFDTEDEAALAYNTAALRLFGDNAQLNTVGVTSGT